MTPTPRLARYPLAARGSFQSKAVMQGAAERVDY